ncbi:MAG: GEVED domain-containing protein [Flavobacteriales bacterium]
MRKISTLLIALITVTLSSFGQYCTSGASYTSDELIANVQLNGLSTNINNNTSTACVGYTDFTALPAPEVLNSGTYTMTVTVAGCSGYNWGSIVGVWIDWDQNQNFTGTGEFIGYSPYSSVNNVNHLITINVPAGAPSGSTRMRIVCVETSSTSGVLACGSYGWGETEDYKVTVLPNVLTVVTPDTIETACYGDDNITIASSTFLGTPPYSWLWSTGSTNDSIFNQGAGTYSVIVTDFVGDKDTSYTVITEPDSIALEATVTQQLVCDYDISAAEAVGSGGTPLEGYLIDTTSANFNPDTSSTGTNLTLGDDAFSASLPIGFEFEFFD